MMSLLLKCVSSGKRFRRFSVIPPCIKTCSRSTLLLVVFALLALTDFDFGSFYNTQKRYVKHLIVSIVSICHATHVSIQHSSYTRCDKTGQYSCFLYSDFANLSRARFFLFSTDHNRQMSEKVTI